MGRRAIVLIDPHEVLTETAHRPWPIPPKRWALAMTWSDLLFAHWPIPPDEIQERLPAGLEVDTFDGQAWLGIVPFRMEMHLRGGLRPPGASRFLELNVRTYVTRDDKPGVWFFSLDASSRLAVEGARRQFDLPYFLARMRTDAEENTPRRGWSRGRQPWRTPAGAWTPYTSQRIDGRIGSGVFIGQYRASGPVAETIPPPRDSLEYFLTERYCFYAVDRRGRVFRSEVHHAPWPLQPAVLDAGINTVADAHGITLPNVPPLLHYAREINVIGWLPDRVA